MIGQRKKLVISLTPTCLKGAVLRGSRIIQAERVAIDSATWNQAWDQNLVPLDRHLRQLLARFAAEGGRTDVTLIYSGSQSVVQIHDIPGSRDDARRAAMLKARESAGQSLITDAVVLARSAGNPSHWIVLTVSDRDDQTNRLYAWINRCGGQAVALIPEAACVAEAAARRALSGGEVTACCFMGHGWSAIGCGSSQGLFLVRAFEFGHRVISDVFQRALDPDGVADDRDLGERAMFESGLPFKSGETSGELRNKVLPLVAPVLQRFCVEIKQTLRFGMPSDTSPSTLILDGPGALIGHLPASVTETLNMHVRLAPGLEPRTILGPFAEGSTEHARAVAPPGSGIRLVPKAAVEYRSTRLLGRSLVGGTLVAGLLLASELAYTIQRERSLDPTLALLTPRLAALTREEDMRVRIEQISESAGAVAGEVAGLSGPTPDWVAALAMIAAVADEHTVFDEIEGHAGPPSEIQLRGACSGPDDNAVSASMTAMMRRFQLEPFVESVEQGSTNREVGADGAIVRSFSVTISLRPVPLPHEALAILSDAAADDEGGRP